MHCLVIACQFQQRLRVRGDSFRNDLAIDELPFPATGDQSGFIQDFQMMRHGSGGHTPHRNDLATVHLVGGRDRFKDPEAGFIGQSF